MANAPLITIVSYDGTSVSVWWQASADNAVTGYTVDILYDASTPVFSLSVTGQGTAFAKLPLDSYQLDSNISYFVQVTAMWGSGPGQDESSQLVPLITLLPELQRVYYDGSDLNFEWTPTPQAVQGYILKAKVVNGGSTCSATIASPGASQGSIPASILPTGGLGSQAWQVSVCAIGNIASNDQACENVSGCTPWVALPSPLPSLQCTGAVYQYAGEGAELTAAWTPVASASGATSYLLVVTSPQDASRYTLSIPGIATGSATLRFPNGLSPAQTYNLQVLALNAAGAGVSTALIPLVTTPPLLASVVYNQAGSGTIDLIWGATGNPAIASYTLEVYAVSGSVASQTASVTGAASTSGSVAVPAGGFNAGQAWAARVTALGGSASAVGASAPVYVAVPVLNNVVCDGESIAATWTPVAAPYYRPPEGYLLSLNDVTAGACASSAFIGGASASCGSVRLPGFPGAGGLTVQAAMVGGISRGPAGAAVPAIIAAPSLAGAVNDVLTGVTTLTWNAVANATAYRLAFSPGGTSVSVAGTSYPLPSGLLVPGSPLSVAIAGGASTGTLNVTGPAGGTANVPAGQPKMLRAVYNGVSARLSWLPVAGASGYTAKVLGTTGGVAAVVGAIAVPATTTEAQVAFAAAAGTVYTAVVQANFNGSSSGPASDPLPLFVPAFFPSETSAQTCYPFVYPAAGLDLVLEPDNAKTGEPILLYLPDIGDGTPLTDPLPFTQGAFTLAVNGGTSASVYPYTLLISNTATPNNPWSFGAVPPDSSPAAIRNGLRADYVAFLEGAEAKGAAAWGIGYLQQIIGRLLPQTFPELLYYNFGLSFPDGAGTTIGSVDLRPGMVMRVVVNPYQMVAGQTSNTGSWLNGFVGGTEIDYDIGSMISNSGQWSMGFDNFIGQLIANGALTVDAPLTNRASPNSLEAGGADSADLYFPGFTGPFYRLFIPTVLQSATSVGSLTTTANFTLAPAATYTELLGTSNLLNGNGNSLGYFRGRTLIKICVRVQVNGVDSVVPIGTTVGNLLERAGCLPPAANLPIGGIALERNLGGAVTNATAALTPAHYLVRLDWRAANAQLYGPNWDLLSMPLLAGDRLVFPA